MSPRAKNILFICTGNTCRSVMAEYMLNKISRERGLELAARSCGVAAERYFQVPPGVYAALKEEGILKLDHVPQLVSRELLSWAELALAMTRAHREMLIEEFPEFAGKVQVLRSYAGLPDEDVADPIGQPEKVYLDCKDKIRQALESLAARMTAESPGGKA